MGFNVYHYLAMVDKQKMVNNIRSKIILAWANEMYIAAHYLNNVTTNIDVANPYGVCSLFWCAYDIVEAGRQPGWEWEFYEALMLASRDVVASLIPYEEGAQRAPIVVRDINPTALEMFGNLAEKIWNVTDLIFNEASTLYSPTGVNPIKRLEEKDILDDIIDGCLDISSYSFEIHDFNPKFQ